MLKALSTILITVGILSIIGALIPQSFTDNINNAIIYFLTYIWKLNNIFDVSVVLNAIHLFINLIIGMGIFWAFYGLINITNADIGGR